MCVMIMLVQYRESGLTATTLPWALYLQDRSIALRRGAATTCRKRGPLARYPRLLLLKLTRRFRMPATLNDVQAAAGRLQFTIPAGHEEDYLALLHSTDSAAEALLAIPGEHGSSPLNSILLRIVLQTTRRRATPRASPVKQSTGRPIRRICSAGGRGKSTSTDPNKGS